MNENKKEDIRYLFSRYCNQLATRKEYEHFLSLVAESENDTTLKSLLMELWTELEAQQITEVKQTSKRFTLWYKLSAAAVALVIVAIGLFFNQKQGRVNDSIIANHQIGQHIAPGGNRAYLTLAGGKKISLTNAANGIIASQSGVQIIKTADGQLLYTAVDKQSTKSDYNTIETPKGGQYQITLPDGTKAWLNAASTLRYPSTFAANQIRKVELTGEAYFEVAKDTSRPFVVHSDKQNVQVLGTHFNINSYPDEPIVKTTLLEGSVRVSHIEQQSSAVLKPGQQARLDNQKIQITAINTAEAVAWKNGKFVFAAENIENIMRKVSRWYNVDVRYEGEITKELFVGTVSRNDNVSEILRILQLTDQVHFKIDGRRITVMP